MPKCETCGKDVSRWGQGKDIIFFNGKWYCKEHIDEVQVATKKEIVEKKLEKPKEKVEEPVLMVAKGTTGQLELLEDRVRLRKKVLFKETIKEVSINQISAVEFKKAGLTGGHIRFSFPGAQADSMEDMIMFTRDQESAFEKLKEAVEKKIKEGSTAPKPGLDELEKLAALKDKGIITEEEFQAKKKQILGL